MGRERRRGECRAGEASVHESREDRGRERTERSSILNDRGPQSHARFKILKSGFEVVPLRAPPHQPSSKATADRRTSELT